MASDRLSFEIMCPDAVDPAMQKAVQSKNIVNAAQFAADQTETPCGDGLGPPSDCQFTALDDVIDEYTGDTERPDALTALVYALMVKRSADIFQMLQQRAYPLQQELLRINDRLAAATRAYVALRSKLLEKLDESEP